jgi:hypothetical protein
MDLTLTLKGKHEGEPIDIEVRDISVLIERQTWDYPGSIDIDYSGIFLVDSEEDEELNETLQELYQDFIDVEIQEAWEDQDNY